VVDQESKSDVHSPPGDVANPKDEGPGCLPAILAGGAIVLMVLFVLCGFSTWYLFQQRTTMAIRTLEGDVIPTVQQSGLRPDEKAKVVALLTDIVDQGKQGNLENWQSSAIMERLIRAPLFQWGDLDVLEATIDQSSAFTPDEKSDAAKQLSRLRRAVELNKAGAVDVNDVLLPVLGPEQPGQLPKFDRGSSPDSLRDAVLRAKLVADRAGVPDESFDVSLATILRREIEAGKSVGGL
jgi:hypothetical protein